MTRAYPVTSQPRDTTRRMKRDAQTLPAEQIVREIFVNSIEHRVPGLRNVAIADVEKLAAASLRDADGNPVFRRIWMDNSSGIPRDRMVHLLQNYGNSSKPSEIFSGNHGEGAVLSGGTVNPQGLVFISKDPEHAMPYVCIWDEEDGEMGLVSFEVPEAREGESRLRPIADADEVPYFVREDGTIVTMHDVWQHAYANPKFPRGLPASGTLVLELGESEDGLDSTYVRTQRTYDSGKGKGTWNYSRWAVGEYLNAHFRKFPDDISLYWGVPGPDFAFNFGEANAKRGYAHYAFKPGQSEVSFEGSKNWGYREAVGLDKTVMNTGTVIEDDDDAEALKGATIVVDSAEYLDGPIPFTAEVIIRDLPPGQSARKLAFDARRKGKVFIDYNDEVFERTEGNPHDLFGITHAAAPTSIWIAIKPHRLGEGSAEQEPGTVWMRGGRTHLGYVDDFGASHDIPWPVLAKQFREAMPTKLVEWIKAKDEAEVDDDLSEPEILRLFERFEDETKRPPKPTPKPASRPEPVVGDPDETETRTRGRGPIVNPGLTHPKSDDPQPRKSPMKRIPLILKPHPSGVPGLSDASTEDTAPPPPKQPEPPKHYWVDEAESWPEDHARWAVIWEQPSTANDMRGLVKLNWNHWYIQDVYTKLAADSSRPNAARKLVRSVFAKSVITKVAHRRKEATRIDLSDDELSLIFSPIALSGFVMGWWDHNHALSAGLKTISAAKDISPDEADEKVAS